MAFESEQNQLRVIFQVERVHDVVLVEHDSFLADLENTGHLFHGTTFRQQLQHILLTRSQVF